MIETMTAEREYSESWHSTDQQSAESVNPMLSIGTSLASEFTHAQELRGETEKRWLTEAAPRRRDALPMPPFRGKPTLPDF